MLTSITQYRWWQLTSSLIALLVFFPIATLFVLSLSGNVTVWSHLWQTVLSDYITGSLQLMFGVAVLTLLLGVGSAWLVSQYRFPGVRFFSWALLLPLAMPAYITAYSYTGLLDIAGPIQTMLRQTFDLSYGDYWFPNIRSMGGAIFVLSFVLYPYVYLLARASFLQQSDNLRDVSQLFGYSRRQAFFNITLPIARPAIIAGLSLALMETLADYGTVDYFGISTFTTGIFRTWYGLGSINSAAQLALILLIFVIALLSLERTSRQQAQFHTSKQYSTNKASKKTGYKAFILCLLCSIPLVFGFLLPTGQLLMWANQNIHQLQDRAFWVLIEHTLILAGLTTSIALMLALLIAYSQRITTNPITRSAKLIVSWGYAIPGTVIAIGILIPLARLDNYINDWFQRHWDISTGLLISGTITALIIAYLARFLAVSLKAVDSGLENIKPSIDQASQSLGVRPLTALYRIHIPMLRGSLLTALLIVFVDVMKELPATLILRPFNFNTLAVRAYELASDERLSDASLAALAIVFAGLIPVILLSKAITKKN